MSGPVIGQIRSFEDVRKALEGIRGWFLSTDFSSQVTTIARTIVQSTNVTDNSRLSKTSNLSDVSSALTAFNNIKQSAGTDYTGVTRHATAAEVIAGENAASAVTPAGLTAKLATEGNFNFKGLYWKIISGETLTIGARREHAVSMFDIAGTLDIMDDAILSIG